MNFKKKVQCINMNSRLIQFLLVEVIVWICRSLYGDGDEMWNFLFFFYYFTLKIDNQIVWLLINKFLPFFNLQDLFDQKNSSFCLIGTFFPYIKIIKIPFLHDRTSDTDLPYDSHLWKESRAFSMDSLFDNTSTSSVEDTVGCCQAQSNQVFIGMVTMQYQARQVPLYTNL